MNTSDVYVFNVSSSAPPPDLGSCCPSCYGEKIKRISHVFGPYHSVDCDELPVLYPRVSASNSWWNHGPVSWLLRPPNYNSDLGWYKIIFYLKCRNCRYEWRLFSKGNGFGEARRKFGRIRIWIFVVKNFLSEFMERIAPSF